MSELFLQYEKDFSLIAHSLEQRFRRSYRATEQEVVTGYKDLTEAQNYIKQMQLSLADIQDINQKSQLQNQLKQRKRELEELQKRFQAYESIIQYNKQKGIIKLDPNEQRQQKADLLLQNGNHKLIEIKYQAYEAEKTSIETQQHLQNQNALLDRRIGGQQDQNRQLTMAEKEIAELQKRQRLNKMLLYGTLGSVIFVLIFILFYRLVRLFS